MQGLLLTVKGCQRVRLLTELVDILRVVASVNVMLMMLYFAKRQYFLLEVRETVSMKIY